MNTLPEKLDFSEIFKKHIEHIEKTRDILQYIDEHPTLILTNLFNPQSERPYYETSFYLIGSENSMMYHTFQQYLFCVLENYFKPDCSIQLKENKYPSAIEILFKDKVIMEFNFYNHTYSIHDRKEINRLFLKKNIADSNLKKAKENLERYHYLNKESKPKDFVERIMYIFFNKKIKNSLTNLFEVRTKEMESAKNDFVEFEKEKQIFKDNLEANKEKLNSLIDFFERLHYKQKDEIDTSKRIQFILND